MEQRLKAVEDSDEAKKADIEKLKAIISRQQQKPNTIGSEVLTKPSSGNCCDKVRADLDGRYHSKQISTVFSVI